MPKQIQIAIQGGGAKIFSLLAAMDAVQTYQQVGKIEVTRVAGTSAGAVVGALFCSGTRLSGFRDELRRGLADRLVGPFTPPGLFKYLWLVTKGKPLWNTSRLREELQQIFRNEAGGDLRVSDLKTEMMITYTNLAGEGLSIHPKDGFVVDGLLHSAGIPYCFRTWKPPGANIVDGGICENLPVDCLTKYPGKGEIIAISFARTMAKEPRNFVQFSSALLDVAIETAMDNARFRLGAESVLTLPQPVGTFEFERAVREGLTTQYENVVERTKKFLDTVINENEGAIGDPWADENLQNLLTLGEMYNAQHKSSLLRYRNQKIEVTANSLMNQKQPDIVEYWLEFETLEDPLYCHPIAATSAQHKTFINKSSWHLQDKDGKEVKILHMPMKDPMNPKSRELLLFFKPVLLANSGPYKLIVKDTVQDAVQPLREKRQDELFIVPRRARGLVDKMEFVIHIPSEFDKAKLVNKPGEDWGQEVDGGPLTNNQPPGFRTLAWVGYNRDSKRGWGVDVKLDG